jgi:predicted Zn-dependent protease
MGWPTNELRLAWLHLLAGDDAAVEERIRGALARLPDNTRARVDYAAFLLARDRPADALAPLREAEALAPRDPDVLHTLGRALALTGDPAAASETYERLLELVPDSWQLHFEAGFVAQRAGQPARVAEHMGEVVRLQPGNDEARVALVEALLELARPAEAVPHCQVFLQRDPGDARAHRLLGTAYLGLKRLKEAERHLRRALQVERDPRTVRALIRLLEGQGRQAEADALRRGGGR